MTTTHEKLCRAFALEAAKGMGGGPITEETIDQLMEEYGDFYGAVVDAILAELMEPSEEMLDAAHNTFDDEATAPVEIAYKAMIKQIQSEKNHD